MIDSEHKPLLYATHPGHVLILSSFKPRFFLYRRPNEQVCLNLRLVENKGANDQVEKHRTMMVFLAA